MRLVTSMALAALLAAPALAQDSPPAGPAEPAGPAKNRVALTTVVTLDGAPQTPNLLQYNLFERLDWTRLRVDSNAVCGAKAQDDWMAGRLEKWKKKAPDMGPASLAIEVTQTATYNDSKFFNQKQAHNFHGDIKCEIKDPTGKVLDTIAFDFSWGRSMRHKKSKSQVFGEYCGTVYRGLTVLLLNHAEIKGRLSEKRTAKLKEFTGKELEHLLPLFEKGTDAFKEGALAKALRALKASQGE